MAPFKSKIVSLAELSPGQDYPDGNINARLHYTEAEIDELAASLNGPDGQIRPFMTATHPEKPGTYFVFAGGRRRLAYERLIGRGDLAISHGIEIRDYGHIPVGDALSKSLADNQQVPMHPADLAQTFATLAADKAPKDIARERGMTLRAVQQSIALGSTLIPEVLALWREGKFTRENVETLTTADAEQQKDALARIKGGDFDPTNRFDWDELKKRITANKGPEMARLLAFVGADNHRAGGGVVTEDFFGKGGVVKDLKLLNKQANAKMKDLVAAELADGWSWCEGKTTESRGMHHGYGECKAKPQFTPDEAKKIASITKDLKELSDPDDYDDETEEAMEALSLEKEAIEIAAVARSYTDKQKSGAGVLINLRSDGTPHYQRGLIRQPEKKKVKTSSGGSGYQQPERPISWEAERALNDWQDAAAGKLLLDHPKESLAMFLASIPPDSRRGGDNYPMSVEDAGNAMQVAKANGFTHAFAELRKLPMEKLAAHMATVAAACVSITSYNGKRVSSASEVIKLIGEKNFADELAKRFDPKVYFNGAGKTHILGVIREAHGEAARTAAAAKAVEVLRKEAMASVGKTGWLPPELRTSLYVKPKVDAASVAKLEPKAAAKTTTGKTSPAPKKKAA